MPNNETSPDSKGSILIVDDEFHQREMLSEALRTLGYDVTTVETGKKALESLHPLGHLGEPDDIAYGILYLASDEAKFVTGSELVIDGGYTAR